jgi:O-antigen/teichoic acid export membrane protein
MTSDPTAAPHETHAEHRAKFFRQSGWLMVANVANGVLMMFVHFLAKKIPASEYGVFGTLLAVTMCVPMIPMQMVLAQQTAHGLATNRLRELAGTIRMIWWGTFALCLVGSAIVLLFQKAILERWGISNPVALWMTLPVVLLSLWWPMFCGVLQGQQNFLWLGWSMMLNGLGRLVVAVFAVMALGAYAAGMMSGVLMGLVVATVIAMWQSRELWRLSPLPFDKRAVLAQVVPLMLGFGAFQFLFTADTMFVKAFFTADETGYYVGAGTLSRALMWLVTPLAMVMFPKIVHSTAKSQKSDLMSMVLLGTGILAALGALGLWILGPVVVKIVYKQSFVAVTSSILPWYAVAMLPLAMANVMLNNLLARSSFRVVPLLVVLAVAYGFALAAVGRHWGGGGTPGLVNVLKTMGAFNILLFAVCGWFTWHRAKGEKVENRG